MAFASKSEQRAALSQDYKGNQGTLTSTSYERKTMAKSDSGTLYGALSGVKGDRGKILYGGIQSSKMTSGLAGNMSGDGYPSGPKWKKVMEPGNLKPGTRAQAGNTVVMKPGQGDKQVKMQVTSKTPKELRGGRVR